MKINTQGEVEQIMLNERHPLAAAFHTAFITDDL